MANEEEEKKKPNIVSGILNDLAMGLGLRERDQSYYDRTAQTIRNNQGQAAGDRYAARMQSQGFPAYGGPIGLLTGGRGIQGPRDFFDGGGLGQSGDRFRGSPYSLIANALGIKPMGYYDRARIGQRGGAGALAALQAGTVPTNKITTPTPAAAEEPLRGTAGTFTAAYELPLTAMSQAPSELTGSADMPAGLLPMTTLSEPSTTRATYGDDAIPNSAFQQLFKRSVAQGYQGADMPSYRAEKNLIEMAKYPNSEYSNNMTEADYASLMPPSLMGEPSNEAPDFPLPRIGNQAVPLRTHGAEFYSQPDITPDYAGDYTRQGYVSRPSTPSIPRGMNLPEDSARARAMAVLRMRFPDATKPELEAAAIRMGI